MDRAGFLELDFQTLTERTQSPKRALLKSDLPKSSISGPWKTTPTPELADLVDRLQMTLETRPVVFLTGSAIGTTELAEPYFPRCSESRSEIEANTRSLRAPNLEQFRRSALK